ncbi:MAG TPA: hypothetical protein VH280_11045 [Verrucomicrobiae bacterium]|jgi:hypothetical protein|nr:hypothetical protein [Verrucomicrobiae bacterium]
MKLLTEIIFGGFTSWETQKDETRQKAGINGVRAPLLIALAICVLTFFASSASLAQTVFVGNTLSSDGNPKTDNPLVILGEFGPASPSASSAIILPSGVVKDVKTYSQTYDFTLYALALVSSGPYAGEQTFQVKASQSFSREVPTPGLLTIAVTNFVVDSGDFLAFAGKGPIHLSAITNGLDATYYSVSNSVIVLGGPGTTFTVGANGDSQAGYQYIPSNDVPSRTYAFGVDVLVTNGCYTFITMAGQATNGAADGAGTNALFGTLVATAVASNYDLFIADANNNRIRRVNTLLTNWVVTTIAGSLTNGSGSANGIGTNAQFWSPQAIAVTTNETVFVADSFNHTIRMMTPTNDTWLVRTIAGFAGQSGTNDGSNSVARFWAPEGIAVDSQTNIYVSDTYNDTIRKIRPVNTNWVVTTIAGRPNIPGTADGTNGAARFFLPKGLALDNAGDVYVADFYNDMIRKLTLVGSNWVSSTVAGTNIAGSADGINTAVRFNNPTAIAVDSRTNIYVADTGNDTIRELIPFGPNWISSTIGGMPGEPGYVPGTGPEARFTQPAGIAVNRAEDLFVGGAAVPGGICTTNVLGQIPVNGFLVEVTIEPDSAVRDRAMWALAGFPFKSSGGLESTNTTPIYLTFSNIPGWFAPVNSSASDSINPATGWVPFTYYYTSAPPVLTITKGKGLWLTGASNATYEIDSTKTLTGVAWSRLGIMNVVNPLQLFPGTNQMVATWQQLTQNNLTPTYYRAKWTSQ